MNKTYKNLVLLVILLLFSTTHFGHHLNPSDWENKKLILIDNKSNTNTILEKPFLITLDSTYIDFSLAKPNGEDLLFVDNDGETILSFWIESWIPPVAKVWVRIPEIPANEEITISMFYGNDNSDTLSNGKTTFDFFNSFENFNDLHKNALTPQEIPTYDGSGQAVHPDIVYIPEGWNGYKYWMAITPYPGSDDSFENPSIVASQDGVTWVEPSGISNPLVPEPNGWNNDPDMLLVDTTMILYFNESNNNKTTYIKRMTSTDGINWSTPEVVISVPWHEMSPTIIYEDSAYYMWYVRSTRGCWSNHQNLTMRTSIDGINWSDELQVNMDFDGRVVWHLDVKKIDSKYIMIFPSYSKNLDCHHTSLFYAESTDKINWSVNSSPIIIPPNSIEEWDNGKIYRTTFLIEDDYLRLWYSAVSDSDIWRIGYSEGYLSEFLDKIFWNEREGDLVASDNFQHSGKNSLKEYKEGSSDNPKVYKSISKKGTYNVWLFDEMDMSSNYKSIFATTDINDKKIGLGINVGKSSSKYVFHNYNSTYSATNILRSYGWHKLSLSVEENNTKLYIDDEYVTQCDGLDESNLTRLSLEGGSQGNTWFDDAYWYSQIENSPIFKSLFNPEIVKPIGDFVIEEDANSKSLVLLDSVFYDKDPSITFTYSISENDSNIVTWIDNKKIWVEPKDNYYGLDSIFISATNQYGLFSVDTFSLVTKPINDPPILKGMPDILLNEDDTVQVDLNSFVRDIDSDTSNIRFIARLLESNKNHFQTEMSVNNEDSHFILNNNVLTISINNINNIATIFAEPDSSGSFNVLFTALDDSLATDSDTILIDVESINDFPILTGLPDSLFVTRDSTIKLEMWDFVSDKETADSLLEFHFSHRNSEFRIDFSKENGVLLIEVMEEFTGALELFISVTDENGAVVKDTLVIKVDEVTGLANRLKNNLPSEFYVNQNYPNPFNPTTTISFDIPEQSKVVLSIYNLLGQKAIEVINDNFEAGSYSAKINASELTSGVYIYLFTAIDLQNHVFVKSKKMILLK